MKFDLIFCLRKIKKESERTTSFSPRFCSSKLAVIFYLGDGKICTFSGFWNARTFKITYRLLIKWHLIEDYFKEVDALFDLIICFSWWFCMLCTSCFTVCSKLNSACVALGFDLHVFWTGLRGVGDNILFECMSSFSRLVVISLWFCHNLSSFAW